MVTYTSLDLQNAHDYCLQIVRSHYENFPVASLLLPPDLRQSIAVIYAFARTADDFADEGNHSAEKRLELLEAYRQKLNNLDNIAKDDLLFMAVHDVVKQYHLPIQLFQDLLTAFIQDVTKKRYNTFKEVLAYCANSANPVGRLLLHMTGHTSIQMLAYSDSICTSLQLINFLQDIEQDLVENNRIYIPTEDMEKFGVTEQIIRDRVCDVKTSALFEQQVHRAKNLMLEGATLGNLVPGRFGLQLRMMINGGLQVLNLLEKSKENCFSRPRLRIPDWIKIAVYSVFKQTIR